MEAERGDGGFTLLELMVVVMIISILLAIAIPSYIGMRRSAADRVVQSNLRNALTTEIAVYTDRQRFVDDPVVMQQNDESLTWTDDPADMADSLTTVYVQVSDSFQPDDTVIVGAQSESGRCFWIRNVGARGFPRFASSDCTEALVFRDRW